MSKAVDACQPGSLPVSRHAPVSRACVSSYTNDAVSWHFSVRVQGSHPCYSKFTNIFRFRVSPLVSGGVYCAYLGYIIVLIPKAINYHNDAVSKVGCCNAHSGNVPGHIPLPTPLVARCVRVVTCVVCSLVGCE